MISPLRSRLSLVALLGAVPAFADGPLTIMTDPPPPAAESTGLWNVPTATLGGRQFWGDVAHFRGWRIQTNVLTGHFRLLDPSDRREAWGTLAQCEAALKQIKVKRDLKPLTGRAIVFVHGIVRSAHSFDAMKAELASEDCVIVGFDYPSTRKSIEESAAYLHQTLQSLEGIERIDFVVHSMGGLVVRQYLAKHDDTRLGRMVMLGVPNHGANMANLFKDVALFKAIYGEAGQQLVEGEQAFVKSLPVPNFPFAIIAGGRGDGGGFNPWITGDDDGTVAVESTRLGGAADFLRVPAIHSFLMRDPTVIAATKRFLSGGSLAESGEADPIR